MSAGPATLTAMADDDYRATLQQCKAGVAADFAALHARFDHLEDEIHQMVSVTESTILRAIRDSGRFRPGVASACA